MYAPASFSTAQPRISQPRIRLSPKERTAFPVFLARADPNSTGRVEGKAAVEFFRRSALPMDTLKEVWTLASAGEGFLDRERFYVAMRLIALAQLGHPVTNESLQSIQEVDLPLFDQSSVPAPDTDPFAISPADKLKYEQIFATQTQGKATLGGQEAKALFDRAGVSPSELTRVWSLADPQDTGVLTKNQFFVAMQLLIKAKNGVKIPEALPPSLLALVAGQVRASLHSLPRPSPPKPAVPEVPHKSEDPLAPQPKAEPSPDPTVLQDLLRVVKALEGRIDSLATDFKSTKAEITSLRDAQSFQIETTNRDLKRYFEQTQTLIESIPRPEMIPQPTDLVENSADLAQELAELKGDIGQMQANLGGMQMEVKAVRGDFGALQREIGSLRGDIKADLTVFQSSIRADISTIGSDIKADITAVQSNIKADIGAIPSEISVSQRDISSIKADISTLERDIKADISTIREDSEGTKLAFQAQFQSLTTGNEYLASTLTSVYTSIQGLKDDLANIPQPDLDSLHTESSQITQNVENVRLEGRETAALVRELGENLQQLAEDFAVLKEIIESRPILHLEDSGNHSDPQEDLLAKADSKPPMQEAKKSPQDPSNQLQIPYEMPKFPAKQTGFLDEFEGNPKEGFDFDLPPAQIDPNPKEEFDFELPGNPKSHDFMFDEMIQGVRKSPPSSPHDFQFVPPQNREFVFDSPQDPAKKPTFDFNFEGEKQKDEFQFEEPDNKDFF